jgi:hypothetical protein
MTSQCVAHCGDSSKEDAKDLNSISAGLIPRSLCVKAVVRSVRVGHSRMFLAGIQAKFGLDPRLKHSGVTNSGHVIVVYRYLAACRGVFH